MDSIDADKNLMKILMKNEGKIIRILQDFTEVVLTTAFYQDLGVNPTQEQVLENDRNHKKILEVSDRLTSLAKNYCYCDLGFLKMKKAKSIYKKIFDWLKKRNGKNAR